MGRVEEEEAGSAINASTTARRAHSLTSAMVIFLVVQSF